MKTILSLLVLLAAIPVCAQDVRSGVVKYIEENSTNVVSMTKGKFDSDNLFTVVESNGVFRAKDWAVPSLAAPTVEYVTACKTNGLGKVHKAKCRNACERAFTNKLGELGVPLPVKDGDFISLNALITSKISDLRGQDRKWDAIDEQLRAMSLLGLWQKIGDTRVYQLGDD